MKKYVFTIQIAGQGQGPMEAYDNAVENFKDDPLEYDDITEEFCEESYEEDPVVTYYRPKTNVKGKVLGHESWVLPCEVWKREENLLDTFPFCTVEKIPIEMIENPVIADE
jgi:hypothetical protein